MLTRNDRCGYYGCVGVLLLFGYPLLKIPERHFRERDKRKRVQHRTSARTGRGLDSACVRYKSMMSGVSEGHIIIAIGRSSSFSFQWARSGPTSKEWRSGTIACKAFVLLNISSFTTFQSRSRLRISVFYTSSHGTCHLTGYEGKSTRMLRTAHPPASPRICLLKLQARNSKPPDKVDGLQSNSPDCVLFGTLRLLSKIAP